MLAAPPTRYARGGEEQIAFQVIGEGPPDVVAVGGPASHLDLQWEDPETARVRRRYGSFARAIFFDRRRHRAAQMGDRAWRDAQIGDRAWRDLWDDHHAIVRELLDRFRGREIKTLGDGFVATFDRPAGAVRCAQEIVEQVGALGLETPASPGK